MTDKGEQQMETYEVLEKALALIEDKRNWCGDSPTGRGEVGPSGEPSRCAAHAIKLASGSFDEEAWTDHGVRVYHLMTEVGGQYLPAFNDAHTHPEVVALFQEAIRSEKAKAGVLVEQPEMVAEAVAA